MDGNTERRRADRLSLRIPLAAGAELAGSCFPAELIDLSETGAKFRIPECDTRPDVAKGRETAWIVSLPSGKLTRFKASARWFHRFPEGYMMGVQFLDDVDETMLRELHQHAAQPA
jgi:hypothetical protein